MQIRHSAIFFEWIMGGPIILKFVQIRIGNTFYCPRRWTLAIE